MSRSRFSWLPRLLVASVLSQAAVFWLRPLISYRILELDGDPFAVSAGVAAFSALPVLIAVPLGQWIDRHGERTITVLGSALVVGASMAALLTSTLPAVIAVSAVAGAGYLMILIGQQSVPAERSPTRADRDRAYTSFTLANSIGQAAGPLLGILALGGGSSQSLPDLTGGFVLTATLAAGAAVAFALISPVPEAERHAIESRSMGGIMRIEGMRHVLVVSMIVVVALELLIAFLPAWGEAAGIAAGYIALLLTVRGLFAIVGRLGLPRLLARYGYRLPAISCSVIIGVGFAILPWSAYGAIVIVAALGSAIAIGQTVTLSWAATLSPRGVHAKSMAVRMMANRVAQVLVPLAAGALAAGPTGVFLIIAGGAAASAIVAVAAPEPPRLD